LLLNAVLRRLCYGRGRPPLSIDIFSPQGAQQQTCRPPLLLSIDGTDRWTDGWTDARQFHRPCSAYYAAGVKKEERQNKWLIFQKQT